MTRLLKQDEMAERRSFLGPMNLFKMMAACGGIGYIKGGGTIAAVMYTVAWWAMPAGDHFWALQGLILVGLAAGGVIMADKLEAVWGKDSSRIVIDEVAGMCCTLLFVPHQWPYALAGLVLFRFFDIVKPLYISAAEKLPGGWGVMADDIVAGIYANLLLQLVVVTNIW